MELGGPSTMDHCVVATISRRMIAPHFNQSSFDSGDVFDHSAPAASIVCYRLFFSFSFFRGVTRAHATVHRCCTCRNVAHALSLWTNTGQRVTYTRGKHHVWISTVFINDFILVSLLQYFLPPPHRSRLPCTIWSQLFLARHSLAFTPSSHARLLKFFLSFAAATYPIILIFPQIRKDHRYMRSWIMILDIVYIILTKN